MDSKELSERVLALSKLRHVREYVPTKPLSMAPEEEKHMRILNGIALMLVTESKGDVAAATFSQTNDHIQVFYAKNSVSKGDLREYINSILSHLSEGRQSRPWKVALDLILMIITKCLKKIRHRASKLIKSLKAVSIDTLDNNYETAEPMFTASQESSVEKYTLVEYMKLLDTLRTQDTQQLSQQTLTLRTVIYKSFLIGRWEKWNGFSGRKDYERVVRRIKKLGDYFGAAYDVAQIYQRYPKASIQVTEGGITAKSFDARFPNLANEPLGEILIKTSVHCELTLLLHSIARTAHTVKIGVSKHYCWLCEKYIEFFQSHCKPEKKVLVAGFQGKIPSGWRLPPDTPALVKECIQGLLKDEMEEIRADVADLARSDSWAAKGELVPWSSEIQMEIDSYLDAVEIPEDPED
ncbi:hypothetical protein MMC07_006063 [Pseudocyphellaria aurata]|nr:hypothetical protein [Pseudocyphellaria aurata]